MMNEYVILFISVFLAVVAYYIIDMLLDDKKAKKNVDSSHEPSDNKTMTNSGNTDNIGR